MKNKEIIEYTVRGEMPDFEEVRAKFHNQAADEISAINNKQKKYQVFKPARILATALVLVLIVGLFNVQAIIAFVGGLFFVPGVGLTYNPNLISAVLDEPVVMEVDGREYRLEFITKVKRESGKCEVMFFLSTENNYENNIALANKNHESIMSDIKSASAIINGKNYKLKLGTAPGGSSFRQSAAERNYESFAVFNYSFPDVNEFQFSLKNSTVNISLSELTDEEKLPNLSQEINGITIAAYKYKNNNSIVGFDIINNNISNLNVESRAYLNLTPSVYDIDGKRLNETGNYGMAQYANTNDGLGYNVMGFENRKNRDIRKVSVTSIDVRYCLDEKSYINVPIPQDGETLYPNIKIPIASDIVYELTSIRREGDALYIEDNSKLSFMLNDPDEVQESVKNNEVGLVAFFTAGYDIATGKLTSLAPDGKFSDLKINTFYVTYYGDFTLTFD
jgi:hypothetical protein